MIFCQEEQMKPYIKRIRDAIHQFIGENPGYYISREIHYPKIEGKLNEYHNHRILAKYVISIPSNWNHQDITVYRKGKFDTTVKYLERFIQKKLTPTPPPQS